MAFRGDLETLILGILQGGELHGYEITKQIKTISQSLLTYGEGQMYPALHALEQNGFVSARWEAVEGKPPRRVYSITDEGRGALSEKRATWQTFSQAVDAMLAPPKAVTDFAR